MIILGNKILLNLNKEVHYIQLEQLLQLKQNDKIILKYGKNILNLKEDIKMKILNILIKH